jgi:hypothetical protein
MGTIAIVNKNINFTSSISTGILDNNKENMAVIKDAVFKVLGDKLVGGYV